MPIVFEDTHRCEKCMRMFTWIHFESTRSKIGTGLPVAETIPKLPMAYRVELLQNDTYMIYVDTVHSKVNGNLDITGLLEAILADCKTGAMVQYGEYHYYEDEFGNSGLNENSYLEIDYINDFGHEVGLFLTIYDDCVNTIDWLQANNMIP